MHMLIDLPPGVYRNGTEMQAAGRWRDCSLVRWHEGALRPIGGWEPMPGTGQGGFGLTGFTFPRGAISWQTNGGDRWFAWGNADELLAHRPDGPVGSVKPSDLTAGTFSAAINTGYGAGPYGVGPYGTPREDNETYTEATTWQFDTWGENLVAVSTADGRLLEWDPIDMLTRAAQIANSPSDCMGLIVTEERFLVALQAGGNPRKIAWSDREDNTTWTPAATNQAGDLELQTNGEIMQAVNTRGGTLILTNTDAHLMSFLGSPFVYGAERVDNAGGVISRRAAATLNGRTYWMGERGFFEYDGGIARPLDCEVSDYVFSDLNKDRASHIWCVTNRLYGEVWWFYVSGGATEVDRYVAINTLNGSWTTGELTRLAGVDQGAFRFPVWADISQAYKHEFGWRHFLSDGAYAETGPLTLGAGDRIVAVREIIPDELVQGEVEVTVKTRDYPNGPEATDGPHAMDNPIAPRAVGRQFRLRFEATGNTDWRIGTMRADVVERGRR